MPSKRTPPSGMDAGAAGASLSPPFKKRSSRAKLRVDDDRPEPNPSSNPSRKSGRKRRSRALPGPAPVTAPHDRRPRAIPKSAAVTSPAERRPWASPESAALTALAAATPPCPSSGAVQRLWSDADEVNLLTGAAEFRARSGYSPRLPDMGSLFSSIRGSLSLHLDQAKVYYKLKRLKSKFLHAGPAAAASRHDLRVRDLCNKVWGAHLGLPAEVDAGVADEVSERRNVPDAAAMLPVATEVLDAYWKSNGPALSGLSLQKGMSLLGTEAARSIEAKWRKQLDEEVHTQMLRHDLAKEVYGLLLDAINGLGP